MEGEALGLLDFLFAKPLVKEDVIESIRDNKTIREEVRKQALILVERFHEEQDPKRFDQGSRTLVRQRYLAPRWYEQAVKQAKTACRLDARKGDYLTTLGIAQYRLSKYKEALDTLTRSDKLNSRAQPADIAFLAMAQHQLGQKDQAQASLNRLREIMKQPQWAKNEEAQGFLREAEALLREQPIKPKK
jgi:tetratricopeptide (TPR) repeat protein